jgi:hypothetical protein
MPVDIDLTVRAYSLVRTRINNVYFHHSYLDDVVEERGMKGGLGGC